MTRNFRSRHGEIDLVMLDGACLVFIEVRYRAGRSIVDAAGTVDAVKQRKLIRAAKMFLACNRHYREQTCRFDVIGIDVSGGDIEVSWIRDAFRPGD